VREAPTCKSTRSRSRSGRQSRYSMEQDLPNHSPDTPTLRLRPSHDPSLCILHGAIMTRVNAIDGEAHVYRVRVADAQKRLRRLRRHSTAQRMMSWSTCIPAFRGLLDTDSRQSLAADPGWTRQSEGERIGATVAGRMLAVEGQSKGPKERANSVLSQWTGSGCHLPVPTPPNFPPQPHQALAACEAFDLPRADQFRPGHLPRCAAEKYARRYR